MDHGLDLQEIKEALTYGASAGGPPPLFKDARDPERWRAIKDSPHGGSVLREIAADAERLLSSPINALPYSLFKLFQETGSRREYEREFFAHRSRLSHFALLTLAYGDRRYLEALEDTIWAICDEYTWCLPAHLGNTCPGGRQDPDDQVRALDLFAAETGFALAEIMSLLEGPHQPGLAPLVAARARQEIFRRVLAPYAGLSKPLWWESAPMNWAAVCAGSIGGAAMYLMDDTERLALLLHRVLKTMTCYLRGFGADGVSTEGVSYWAYGFGYFAYFAALLKERTAGKLDLFREEKIEQIALFPQRCYLTGNQVVCFSDCSPRVNYQPGLMAYLQGEFAGIRVPEPQYGAWTENDGLRRWANIIRSLVWGMPATDAGPPAETAVYFPDAQWLLTGTDRGAKRIRFAAKGGHNDEPHNHNDIGSFVIHVDGDTLLADLGRGEYSRQYFGPERYGFLCTGSRGHSVPIIDGRYQQEGREHAARVLRSRTAPDRDELVLEMAAAYGEANLKSLVRSFAFDKTGSPYLLLEDAFAFVQPPHTVVERLITPYEPIFPAAGRIRLAGAHGRLEIEYPREEMHVEVGKEPFTSHEAEPMTVYLIDLVHDRVAKEFSVKLKFLCVAE